MKSKHVLTSLIANNEKIVVMPEELFNKLRKNSWHIFLASLVIDLLLLYMIIVSSVHTHRYIATHEGLHKELGRLEHDIGNVIKDNDELYEEIYDYLKRNPRTADYYIRFGIPTPVAEKAVAERPKKKYSTKKRTKR